MLRFLLNMTIALGCLIGIVLAMAGYVIASTPSPESLKGCLTATMHNVPLCPGSKDYVPIQQISPYVRHAVIVSEDSGFYQHNGLDLHELQESIDENIKEGKYARGGSTITQQLAKNVYLSGEKSIFRKIREAMIALQIEKILKKDEILERYLNVVEFGPDIYGIKKATQFYFGKSPDQLTVLEGAWLAFLLPNPKKYSQSFRKRELTKFARHQLSTIVSRMGRFKKIPQEEADAALNQLEYMFKPVTDPQEQLTPEELETLGGIDAEEAPTAAKPAPTPEQVEEPQETEHPESTPAPPEDFPTPADDEI